MGLSFTFYKNRLRGVKLKQHKRHVFIFREISYCQQVKMVMIMTIIIIIIITIIHVENGKYDKTPII